MERWIRVLCGYVGSSWQNPDLKWKFTRGEGRVVWPSQTTEILSEYAGAGMKPQPVWSWIWGGMWRAARRKACTDVSATGKENKGKYGSSTGGGGESSDKECRRSTHCLLCLGPYCVSLTPGPTDNRESMAQGRLTLCVGLKCLDKPDV